MEFIVALFIIFSMVYTTVAILRAIFDTSSSPSPSKPQKKNGNYTIVNYGVMTIKITEDNKVEVIEVDNRHIEAWRKTLIAPETRNTLTYAPEIRTSLAFTPEIHLDESTRNLMLSNSVEKRLALLQNACSNNLPTLIAPVIEKNFEPNEVYLKKLKGKK